MANFSTYGVVGDGVTDDTVALQNALDSDANLIADAGSTFKISARLNIDTVSNQTINWNNSTLTTDTTDLSFIRIDKRVVNGGTTVMQNLLIDGNNIGSIGVEILSRSELTNINGQDYAQSVNSTTSPAHLKPTFASNDSDTHGDWIFDGCDVDGLWGYGDYCDYCDGIGAANGYLIYWNVVPSSTTRMIFKNASVLNGYGVDGQNIGIFSPGIDVSYSAETIFDNITTQGFNRRGWKIFCGGVTVKNSLIQDTPATEGLTVCGTDGRDRSIAAGCGTAGDARIGNTPNSAGMFTFGTGSGSAGSYNYRFENTRFVGISGGRDSRVIPADTDDVIFSNCSFEGGSDIAITTRMGDMDICNSTFNSGSTVYDYNISSDTGQIRFGNNNTYASGYNSTNNLSFLSSIQADLSCPLPTDSGIPNAVGDGITDDTTALQAALDSEVNLIANSNAIFRITSTLDVDTISNQTIDFNGATITVTGNSSFYAFDINKSDRSTTVLRNLNIDGNELLRNGILVQSPIDADNVNIVDLYDADNSVIAWSVPINAIQGYGTYTWNDCDVTNIHSLSNSVIGDNQGSARMFDIQWNANPPSTTTLTIEDFVWDGCYGEDGGPIRIDDRTAGVNFGDTTHKTILRNGEVKNYIRRGMKIACDNVEVYNTSFAYAESNNPKYENNPAGIIGIRPLFENDPNGTLDNIIFEGCTFDNTTYPWIIVDNMDNLSIRNCNFTNGAGIRLHNSADSYMGNWTICNTTFSSGSQIIDQLDTGSSGSGQLPGTTLTYDTNNSVSAASIITFNNTAVDNVYSYQTVDIADCNNPNAMIYYVATNGGTGTGTENDPWSLSHAFATAVAGDIVYVKAGTYNSPILFTSRAGTSSQPIKFIGYKTVIGDIESTEFSTYTKSMYDADNYVMTGVDMPLLQMNRGSDLAPEDTDRAFYLEHSYIHLENFKIQYYQIGVDITNGDIVGIRLKNIVCNEMGSWDPSDPGYNQPAVSGPFLSGQGIYSVGMNDSEIIDCAVYDAGAAAYFIVNADNILLENCEAYITRSGNSSDYLFDFVTMTNSKLTNYIAHRDDVSPTMHQSRAVMMQISSNSNIVEKGTHFNVRTQVEVQSNDNTFRDIKVIGNGSANQGEIQISGESNNNIFYNWEIDGTGGIQFLGAGDSRKPGVSHVYAGNNNYFINFKISNVPTGSGNAIFSFHRLGFSEPDDAGTNYVIGLTADNSPYIINTNRTGTLHIYNSSFSNVTGYDTFSTSNGAGDAVVDINYYNCNFYNNGFSTPSNGPEVTVTNVTSGNPLLDSNLIPQTGSALINAGMDTSTLNSLANKDITGGTRSVPYDIGAYEFGAVVIPEPEPIDFLLKRNSTFTGIH